MGLAVISYNFYLSKRYLLYWHLVSVVKNTCFDILFPLLFAINPGTWILVFIWSKIKSFCHNLSQTSYQKTSFTKVSAFDNLKYVFSFGRKLSHFVTTSSWLPIKKLLLQEFHYFVNLIRKCEKHDMDAHLVTNTVIWSQSVPKIH